MSDLGRINVLSCSRAAGDWATRVRSPKRQGLGLRGGVDQDTTYSRGQVIEQEYTGT